MSNLAQGPELKSIKLKDGKEYELTELDLNMMIAIEDKFGQPFAKLFETASAKVIRYLLYTALIPKYPDLTEQQVGALVSAKILTDTYATIVEQMVR